MRRRFIIGLCLILIVSAATPILAQEYTQVYQSREGDTRLGGSIYMLPIFNVEMLKLAPFGLGYAYGITEKVDLIANLAPLNYYTAMVLPDMIAGNEFLFVYVGEVGMRYNLAPGPSSFYLEADAATLGIYGSSEDPDSILNDLIGNAFFYGGGFGFSGPVGNGTLSVGLHGYRFLSQEAGELPFIPLIKASVLW